MQIISDICRLLKGIFVRLPVKHEIRARIYDFLSCLLPVRFPINQCVVMSMSADGFCGVDCLVKSCSSASHKEQQLPRRQLMEIRIINIDNSVIKPSPSAVGELALGHL